MTFEYLGSRNIDSRETKAQTGKTTQKHITMVQKVHFQEKIDIHEIRNKNEISDKEKSETWYTKNELNLLLGLYF